MNTLNMTSTAMREHNAIYEYSAIRELSKIELDQVSGGQSTEGILDRRPCSHNG